MNRRLWIGGLVAAFALFTLAFAAFAAFAVAQEPNVQITKGPALESVTGDSAVIAWSTNVNASTVLRYGTGPASLTNTAEAPWGGLTHRVTLHELQPNTTYYFDVESAQGQGTGTAAISDITQFKTANSTVSVPAPY